MIFQGKRQPWVGNKPTALVLPPHVGNSPSPSPIPVISEITIQSEGINFAPVIVLNDGYTIGTDPNASVLWTFSDGTTDATLTPSKDYGSIASRANKLVVTPWSALRRINVGYAGEDGGSAEIEYVDQQNVSAMSGLSAARAGLKELCICESDITSIDILTLTHLETLECFDGVLTSINPPISIKRLCVENNDIGGTLDLAHCSALKDLRAAVNAYTSLILPTTAPNLWHICVRQNSLTSLRTTGYPALLELFIWNNPSLTGTLEVDSAAIDQISANDCAYDTLDLSEIDTVRTVIKVGAGGNELTSVIMGSNSFEELILNLNTSLATLDLTGQTHLQRVNIVGCSLTAETVEHVLHILDASAIDSESEGVYGDLYVNLTGGTNADANANAVAHAASLTTKGWTVTYNSSEIPTDLTEDMEDTTLATGLTLTNPASLITLPSTAWHYKGAASMRVNLNAIAAPHHLSFALASGTFAVGFAYKCAVLLSGASYYPRICGIGNSGNEDVRIADQFNNDDSNRRIVAWVYGSYYLVCAVTNGQEVRIAISYTQNGAVQVQAYNMADDTLLGTANATTENGAPTYIRIGALAPVVDVNTVVYFDQIKLDYDKTLHPILV